jgi:Uma2 family endonuclease
MEAVATLPKLPETLDEIAEGDILRIPATWNEYLDLAEEVEYNIQFLDGNIIIMSQATDTHEALVARLIKLMAIYFDDLDEQFQVLGSNVKIVIPGRLGDFNADLSVVRGPSEYGPTPTGRESRVRIQNPEIVVEVLSKGTYKFDRGQKFAAYQTIPSLQHILLVDQRAVNAWICSRTDRPNQWLQTQFQSLADTIPMGDFSLNMQDIYRKIDLAA